MFYLGLWRHIIDTALVLITLESCIVISYRRTDDWSVLHTRVVLLYLSLTIYDNLSYLSKIIMWLIACLTTTTSMYVLCRCIPTLSTLYKQDFIKCLIGLLLNSYSLLLCLVFNLNLSSNGTVLIKSMSFKERGSGLSESKRPKKDFKLRAERSEE